MTSWTVERMVYRKARQREVFVGHRISARGGQAWIEQGELHAGFEVSFSHVTREVDLEEYQSRVVASPKMSLIMPRRGERILAIACLVAAAIGR